MPRIISESKEYEVQFPQKSAIINFGITPLSTYNLVNCIAIGGSFRLKNERVGSFLTHESPTDYITLQKKLTCIHNILSENAADILFIVVFHSDDPGKDKYAHLGGMTTSDIVKTMIFFCEKTFPNIKLIMKTYTNSLHSDVFTGTFLCGKATISPTDFSSSLTPLRSESGSQLMYESKQTDSIGNFLGNFLVIILYDSDGKKIYKCPECKVNTGTYVPLNPTDVNYFSHTYKCSNKGKIPIEV
jgi:hypothetical protein